MYDHSHVEFQKIYSEVNYCSRPEGWGEGDDGGGGKGVLQENLGKPYRDCPLNISAVAMAFMYVQQLAIVCTEVQTAVC